MKDTLIAFLVFIGLLAVLFGIFLLWDHHRQNTPACQTIVARYHTGCGIQRTHR